jgi:hypothetical protein
MKTGIYSNNSGAPQTLLGTSDEQNLGDAYAWLHSRFPHQLALPLERIGLPK